MGTAAPPTIGMEHSDGTDTEEVLGDIVRRLVAVYRPERVYLFGSRARAPRDALADSDYDVLVIVASSDEPVHRRARAAYRALAGVPAAVDVLVWTRQEFEERAGVVTSLAATVADEGRLLHVS